METLKAHHTNPTNITIFLQHGDANGLRSALVPVWNGKAFAAPRTELDELLAIEDLANTGVYILFGKADVLSGEKPHAYIGQAEVICDRLKRHKSEEFWISAIVFVGNDNTFTVAHARYLERQLIAEATEVDRFTLDNDNSSKAKLPEEQRTDIDEFLFRIRQLLPLLGSNILVPIVQPGANKQPGGTLFCCVKGAEARGHRTTGGFVVLQGSTAVLQEKAASKQYAPHTIARRKQLVDDGTLVQKDGFYAFTKDAEFSSPSAAAAVITGGTADGLSYWRTEDGQILKELEQQA
jgi:hypothetical protein